jgi:hypothetical protein
LIYRPFLWQIPWMLFAIKGLFVLLCLVFFFLYRRDGEQWKWPLVGSGVAGLVVFAAGFFVTPLPPGGNPIPYHKAVGHVLGQRVSRDGASARVILVQSPGMHYYKADAVMAAERAGLVQGLGSTVELVEYRPPIEDLDPEEEDVEEYLHAKGWRKDFATWLEDQAPADALVSFIGLPARMSKSSMEKLPPAYMLSHSSVDEESPLVLSGKLKAFATYRSDYDSSSKPTGSGLEKLFEARYQLIEMPGK